MMSVFRLIGQHQFMFLCYMLPTWQFRSVHAVNTSLSSTVRLPFCLF